MNLYIGSSCKSYIRMCIHNIYVLIFNIYIFEIKLHIILLIINTFDIPNAYIYVYINLVMYICVIM